MRPARLSLAPPAVAALLLALNLFGAPRFKEDEGEITAQAYGLLHASLQPALFGYHHSPAVPLQLAGWLVPAQLLPSLTVIEASRLAMVGLAAVTALMVFRLGAKAAGPWQGLGAGLLFATCPLLVLYGRWVLPDPFSAAWLAGSVLLLLGSPASPRRHAAAGVLFGLAVLSKEVALVAGPGLLLLAWSGPAAGRGRRLLAAAAGTAVPVLAYLLWAASQGALAGSSDSVASGMLWQAGRLHDGGALNPNSRFYALAGAWVRAAPLPILGSLVGGGWLVGAGSSRATRALGVVALSFWLFFGSGLIVQDYYVVAALPFWCLAAVLGLVQLATQLAGQAAAARWLMAAAAAALVVVLTALPTYVAVLSGDHAASQRDLLSWERAHLSSSSVVVDDGTDSLDLRYGDRLGGHSVNLACNYWNRWCLRSGAGPVYVVLDGELDYLAKTDPAGFGDLARRAHQGRQVWSATGLSDGDYIRLMQLAA